MLMLAKIATSIKSFSQFSLNYFSFLKNYHSSVIFPYMQVLNTNIFFFKDDLQQKIILCLNGILFLLCILTSKRVLCMPKSSIYIKNNKITFQRGSCSCSVLGKTSKLNSTSLRLVLCIVFVWSQCNTCNVP